MSRNSSKSTKSDPKSNSHQFLSDNDFSEPTTKTILKEKCNTENLIVKYQSVKIYYNFSQK
jgi:hypothetical protein